MDARSTIFRGCFSVTTFFDISTDVFETLPHDVHALRSTEALLYGFP